MTAFEDEPILISREYISEQHEVFEITPESSFDARVIAQFDAVLEVIEREIEKDLITYQDNPTYDLEKKQKEVDQLEVRRSSLFAQRAIYEVDMTSLSDADYDPRETHLPLFINNITIFRHKLSVFRVALSTDNMSALQLLGDLRSEAEHSGDIDNIALYALEEAYAGLNIHENIDIARTVIQHRESTIREDYVKGILRNVVYARLAKDDAEGARHALDLLGTPMTTYHNEYSNDYRAIALVEIAEKGLSIKDVTKRGPYGLDGRRKYSEYHRLAFDNVKSKYRKLFRVDGNINDDPLTLSMLDSNWHLYTDVDPKTFNWSPGERELLQTTAPEFLKRCEVAQFHANLAIYKKHLDGEDITGHNAHAISLKGVARLAFLAKRYGIEDESDKVNLKLQSAYELLLEEYAAIKFDRRLSDTVDSLRVQVSFNRKIEGLVEAADGISSPSMRYAFLESVISMQAMHDPDSKDSQLLPQLEKLLQVGKLCIENPMERILVNQDTIDASFMKIDEIASKSMQQ